MPVISLDVRHIDYISDKGLSLRAHRVYAQTVYTTTSQRRVAYRWVVDTGAPISVVPYSLWQGRGLSRRVHGTTVLRLGVQRVGSVPETLEWQGIPCELCSTEVFLRDVSSSLEVGPFLLVAKFAISKHPQPNVEGLAILGLNFLADNKEVLTLDSTKLTAGSSEVIEGFLTVT